MGDLYEKGSFLQVLQRAESLLPKLLTDTNVEWTSLDVDYEPPRVERLWCQFEGRYRIYLHRIHPCFRALFHPHPWPSAVKVLSGAYEMGVGYGPGQALPPVAMTLMLAAGSSYEMVDPDGWHYVRPLGISPCLSVMVTGSRWDRWSPGPAAGTLKPLKDQERSRLMTAFKLYYDVGGEP
jgi:hypothetical protein